MAGYFLGGELPIQRFDCLHRPGDGAECRAIDGGQREVRVKQGLEFVLR